MKLIKNDINHFGFCSFKAFHSLPLAFPPQAHPQRLELTPRRTANLSHWASLNIREVRQIRLLLVGLIERPSLTTFEADVVDERRLSDSTDTELSIKKLRGALDNLTKLEIDLRKQLENKCSLQPFDVVVPLDQIDLQSDMEEGLRRIDWLVGRNEACRWLQRTNHRTFSIHEGLASCSRFIRNTGIMPLKSALDLLEISVPQVTTALIDRHTRSPILYVQVGDVMHCLISFGNLCMESVVVRGMDEGHCVRGRSPRQRGPSVVAVTASAHGPRVSCAMADLIQSQLAGGDTTYLLPGKEDFYSMDSSLPSGNELDLTTPSRHPTFARVTEIARNALVYFSATSFPSSQFAALETFCKWLGTYASLYSHPCDACGLLLGATDASLPVIRTYGQSLLRALHEHCRVAPGVGASAS